MDDQKYDFESIIELQNERLREGSLMEQELSK